MTADRRRQVEALCLEALALEPDARAAFLDRACGSDEALRHEVDTLLAGQADAAGFLEQPAWHTASTPLTPGTRLGPYQIDSAIGAGGMGEVYRATDTRLSRTVAIKVLPAGVASDPARRRRFEHEARAASALNHPHICALYDIGSQAAAIPGAPAVDYLVMEHLEGQTLAARLASGKLSLAQALEIGTQVADALSAAHKHGIVHRDLKPGNVMLTKSDTPGVSRVHAKLLDFGLAKLHTPKAQAGVHSELATEPASGTTPGLLLGTVPYMAPEQVEGKDADARTDLFAFGAVLYEMLTGTRAFTGSSSASVMAAILEHDPAPVSQSQPTTPPLLDRLIRRCLAKDPDARWQSAADVADELRWIAQSSDDAAARTGAAERTPARRLQPHPVWWLAVGLTVCGLAVGALVWTSRPAPPRLVTRFSITVAPAERLGASGLNFGFNAGGSRTGFTWTPDGRALVFTGKSEKARLLFVHWMDEVAARPLEGTSGAQAPAVSPDGQAVAFFGEDSGTGAIRKVSLSGGASQTIVEAVVGPPRGIAWGPGDQILFGANTCTPSTCDEGKEGRIWLARGGGLPPTPVTELAVGERTHGLPQWLPDGKAFLYTVRKRALTWSDEAVVVQSLATKARKVLLTNAADGRYVASGHLVFMRMGTLFAVRFDLATLEVRGQPVALVPNVVQALTGQNSVELTGAGQFAVSPAGHLAYLPGPVVPYRDSRLVTIDRKGHVTPLSDAPVRSYDPMVRLSPDGQRLAVGISELKQYGLWMADLSRDGRLTYVTRGGECGAPIWMPGGKLVTLECLADGLNQIIVQAADGTGSPTPIRRDSFAPAQWAPDGKHLIGVKDGDIVEMDVERPSGALRSLVSSSDDETGPSLSPDGLWLAYDSDRSGSREVYVQPYPGPESPIPVSISGRKVGGSSAAWRADGRELFFVSRPASGPNRMMAASVDLSTAPPRFGTPRPLFEFAFMDMGLACTPVRCYDVAPDGQRFFGVKAEPREPTPPTTQINVVLNWLEEVRRKVPTR